MVKLAFADASLWSGIGEGSLTIMYILKKISEIPIRGMDIQKV